MNLNLDEIQKKISKLEVEKGIKEDQKSKSEVELEGYRKKVIAVFKTDDPEILEQKRIENEEKITEIVSKLKALGVEG